MADDVRVTNWPADGSPHRVAFDLMGRITAAEHSGKANPTGRGYYLTLYSECLKAVRGSYNPDMSAAL